MPILAQYESALNDLQTAIAAARAQQTGALVMAGLSIVIFAFLCTTAIRRTVPAWYPPLALPVAAVYGRKHLDRRRAAFRNTRLAAFHRRGIERLTGAWMGRGESGEEFSLPGHLYERDLNILGGGSLFELLCTARTQLGRSRLANFLLHPADTHEALARQQAVKELAPKTSLREALHLLGAYDFQGCDWEAFRDWLAAPPVVASTLIRLMMACCSGLLGILLLSIFAGALSLTQAVPVLCLLAAAQLLCAVVWTRTTRPVLRQVRQFGLDIGILREGLHLLAKQQFTSPKLTNLVAAAHGSAHTLHKLERLVNAVYECDKEWFYAPARLLLIPTQLALAIERWKSEHAVELRRWADAWAEFEALNALGCYAHEHPDDVFPALDAASAAFHAKGLGHPLIREDKCVRNDVDLGANKQFYMVSGSNMAGKSTFLRAIGTNAVLAAAGAPIRALTGTLSTLSVCASICTADSLTEGKSRFLAEVERLRETFLRTAQPKPVLFLIDELFSGTNSTDRRIAAEAVVRQLVEAGAVGALSTHDLALTEIADLPELNGENVHMASDAADPLSFDYKLKPGICTQSNALAIVQLAGVPV